MSRVRFTAEHPSTLSFFQANLAWFNHNDKDSIVGIFDLLAKKGPQILGRLAGYAIDTPIGGLAMATALEAEHVSGSTEPWIQDILVALLRGLQRSQPTVLECGGFLGHTSAKLALALEAQGGGTLIVAEYDPDAPERADRVCEALAAVITPHVTTVVRREDAIAVIKSLPVESVDFAFLDDDHTKLHVDDEINALWPKMRTGGLITGHDVYGSCDLQEVFRKYGGYALDLPRLGPAGGIGILQVR